MRRLAPFLLVGLIAFIAYGSVLWNGAGFSHPDDMDAAASTCYLQRFYNCQFRPFTTWTYMANARLGGWWMEVNFGLHLMAALLVLSLSRSLLAACLFAAHPFATDAVASVSGRSGLLTGIAVLLLVLGIRRWKWKGLLPGGLLLVGFAGVHPAYYFRTVLDHPKTLLFIRDFFSALSSYVFPRMVVPLHLSTAPEIHFAPGFLLLSLAGLGIAGWVAIRWSHTRLGLGLAILPLLPFAFVSLPDVFLEHRGYIALAGVSILLAKLPKRVALVLIPLFCVLSIIRCDVYSSGLKLWKDAASKSHLMMPHMNLAASYGFRNDYDNAEKELIYVTELFPENGHAWDTLDMLYRLQGNPRKVMKLRSDYFEFLKTPKGQELYGRQ